MRLTWLCAGWLSLAGLTGCLAADTDRDTATGESSATNTDGIDDGATGAGNGGSGGSGGNAAGGTGTDTTATSGGQTNGGTNAMGSTGEDDAGSDEPATSGDNNPSDDVPAGDHCADVAGWDPTWSQYEEEVLLLTNEARAKGHNCDSEGNFGPAPALTMEAHLRCAARLHSQYMADTSDFNHTQTSTGLDPFERMMDAGYSFLAAGENIAVGQMSPQEVVDGWLDSDGHCSNIMSKDFTQIGIGYDEGPFMGFEAPYWTQNFGRPR